MKILALYNIKGGVGKTAAAVNLAYYAAQQGFRSLVWDLDPQGASSFYFRIKPKVKGGAKKLIKGKSEIDDLIKGTDFPNLDLIPGDFSFRHLDLKLDDARKPTRQLSRILSPVKKDYDYIFLDCPPSISLLSESIFETADVLVAPIIPTTLSVRTLEQLEEFIAKNKLKQLQLLPFFSMVDKRKKLHTETLENLPKTYPSFLSSSIPYASEVERMGLERSPVELFAPRSRSAESYAALWQEIYSILKDQ